MPNEPHANALALIESHIFLILTNPTLVHKAKKQKKKKDVKFHQHQSEEIPEVISARTVTSLAAVPLCFSAEHLY